MDATSSILQTSWCDLVTMYVQRLRSWANIEPELDLNVSCVLGIRTST